MVCMPQGWQIQIVWKCRVSIFLRFLLMWADLVEGKKSSSRHLKTAFQKSISASCKHRVWLWVKALQLSSCKWPPCSQLQQPLLFAMHVWAQTPTCLGKENPGYYLWAEDVAEDAFPGKAGGE